ncbi:propionyl-CoA carboxylase alpha chain, mitochondrial-like isoform X1 [Varroa jacobsoni]|uniref:propionyl-CoA carboxylase alpha chain, mitochondrial-like isoform X1 n=1 Tax=Varroa jacobsoni TaxID=62625 RepID=UPI000BF6E75B|nr:propionyl-CoA carboxylase alpha chain, mitochondrial-like isoform X1 [Varroa jacobsoni]XP_022691356.1 propionyl-CoA carboxylase alpha chain, mitochondrial-like isoform X1 [Varroa jacobsoni]
MLRWLNTIPRNRGGSAVVKSTGEISQRGQRTLAEAAAAIPSWQQLVYTTDPIDTSEQKFGKILIANRGEIACRIIDTCRRMGIRTVAVFSDVDSRSLFARMADEAFCIGPAPTNLSYLNIEAIMDAVRKSGAEAVHPGYGFLSENTAFAARLEKDGVSFIGPNAKAIESMGDKIMSKQLANEAKVNCIPGYDGVVNSPEEAIKIAHEIGYPVMIKASAGGGGKGMRVAWNDKEAAEGFRFSKDEAAASFGDDRLLIEKYIDNPRHIEIQFLCDKHGNGIYLNERECSIQRRNQKVIEEAPSTFVTPELRKAMGEQALALAKAVGYDSAGTCEFLVDSGKNFYFLEMNTRLQVEHPITECITGVDLVQQMIRIAKGHPLKITQDKVPLNGWAFESRVYAEDPFKNFGLPSVGRLHRYIEPTDIPQVRCDSGIVEGSEISIYYDPMICKLVTYGPTRDAARNTMIQALDKYVIRGVSHNIALLRAVMEEERFIKGDTSTSYLTEVWPKGFSGIQLTPIKKDHLTAIAASVFVQDDLTARAVLNSSQLRRTNEENRTWELQVENGPEKSRTSVMKTSCGKYVATIGSSQYTLRLPTSLSQPTIEVCFDEDKDIEYVVQLPTRDFAGNIQLRFEGTTFNLKVVTSKCAEFLRRMPEKPKPDASKQVMAPMPGLVKSVAVGTGDLVAEHQEVCVVEAMKMQNSLVSNATGKVKAVLVKAGEAVEEGQLLVELE